MNKSKYKKTNSSLLKKLSEFTIEDFLLMVAVAFIFMVAAFFISPQTFRLKLNTGAPFMEYLMYVLNFSFLKYIFSLLVALLVMWILKLIFAKNWKSEIKWGSFVVGIFLFAVIIIFLPSGNHTSINSSNELTVEMYTEFLVRANALKPGESTADFLPQLDEVLVSRWFMNSNRSGLYKYQEFKDDFCGERIEYYFTVSCGSGLDFESYIKELEGNLNTNIESYCIGINDKELCKSAGYNYPENYSEWKEQHTIAKTIAKPVIIIGCKYAITGQPTLEDISNLICEKIGDCTN